MPNFRFSQPNMSIVDEFAKIVGPDRISFSSIDRANYSHDLWPMTSIWLQGDEFPYPPQMIVWPKSVAEIVRILKMAVLHKVQVIPYGAGSGVCGGTLPVGGGMILDLKLLNKILDLDEESLLVTVQPGMIGENFERQLNRKGYTLGHFPSSIYCSTVGGWLATRSAGQLSSRYGKIEDMVVGLEVVIPSGEILKTRITPRAATGPDFKQLFIGSEGTLGIITKATLRIWPLPEHRIYQSFEFNSVTAGLDAIRDVMQAGLRPAVVRLYDEIDTMMVAKDDYDAETEDNPVKKMVNQLLSKRLAVSRAAQRVALGSPRVINTLAGLAPARSMMVMIFEGNRELIEAQAAQADKFCRRSGGEDQGEGPAKHWMKNRYKVSYKMSPIFAGGSFVDTIEVSATWERLQNLYFGMKEEIARNAFVMAHFSHAYPDGCSIYFTFVGNAARQDAKEKKYHRIWRRALDTCLHYGGSISHHHGIGFLKQQQLEEELGGAMKIFRVAKDAVDPYNVLNPGKMGL